MATRKVFTKKQAEALLAAYEKEQSDAVNKAIAAYDKKADAALQKKKEDAAASDAAAKTAANVAYDEARVKELVARRRIAEQLANWGLSSSGVADSAYAGLSRTRQAQNAEATAKKQASLTATAQALVAAKRETDAKKAENAAAARKTLASKVAEKRLTLMRTAK